MEERSDDMSVGWSALLAANELVIFRVGADPEPDYSVRNLHAEGTNRDRREPNETDRPS